MQAQCLGIGEGAGVSVMRQAVISLHKPSRQALFHEPGLGGAQVAPDEADVSCRVQEEGSTLSSTRCCPGVLLLLHATKFIPMARFCLCYCQTRRVRR